MAKNNNLRRSMDDLKRGIKQAVEDAASRADDTEAGQTHNINAAGRVNKSIVTNVGEPGSVQGASSRQKVRIRQDGEETYEETETTKTTF